MGEQGLAERLAAETDRSLRICSKLGDRLESQLHDEAALALRGVKLGAPDRAFCRALMQYRMLIRDHRIDALVRHKLGLQHGADMPMTEEEYRAALEEIQGEALSVVDRADLEQELRRRPLVQLPAGARVLDAASTEVSAPRASEPEPVPPWLESEEVAAAELGAEPPARPAAPVSAEVETDPDDEDGGYL